MVLDYSKNAQARKRTNRHYVTIIKEDLLEPADNSGYDIYKFNNTDINRELDNIGTGDITANTVWIIMTLGIVVSLLLIAIGLCLWYRKIMLYKNNSSYIVNQMNSNDSSGPSFDVKVEISIEDDNR